MRGILENSGKEPTFHGECVAREHGKDTGRRFFDLIEVDIAEKTLRAAAVAGINYYGPNLAKISRERERLLMEQAEKEKEEMEFELATNGIMFTEVMVAEQEAEIASGGIVFALEVSSLSMNGD